jgi:hypothetical protein
MCRAQSGTARVKAFGLLTLAFGCGAVMAPATGGLLARPAALYPATFGRFAILKTAPYLLPCMVCMAVQTMALVITYFALPAVPVAPTAAQPPPADAAAAADKAAAAPARAQPPGLRERLSFLKRRGPMLACGAYALDCFVNVLYDLAVSTHAGMHAGRVLKMARRGCQWPHRPAQAAGNSARQHTRRERGSAAWLSGRGRASERDHHGPSRRGAQSESAASAIALPLPDSHACIIIA